MASEWKKTTIGQLIAELGGSIKTGPFGTTLKASEYSSEGVPLISVGEIGYGTLRIDEETPRVPRVVIERLPEYLLCYQDIVFGRKGAVDRSAYITQEQDGWFLGSDGIRLRLSSACDRRFIAFQLQSLSVRNWIFQHATGSTMASLNQGIIERIPIVLPPLAEQRAIARILGALDDKIELNRRQNATLEELAHAIFKSWFVDFDPVRAKAEGRAPAAMDAATAALFPDGFEKRDGREMPRGWRASTIGESTRVVGGSTPSTTEPAFWEGGTHYWATPKDLSSLSATPLLETERRVTDMGLSQISSGLLPKGTVLLSSRAPIGYTVIADVPVAINQGFIAMICERESPNHYVLWWTRANMEEIKGRANGTTFLEISKANFRPLPVLIPSSPILSAFIDVAEPLYQKVRANLQQSRTLAALRDALLPRLLSGELRVREAERLVEEQV